MSNQGILAKIRGKLHTDIRREQIQLKFQVNRQLLNEIDPVDATSILLSNLQVVKTIMESPQDAHGPIDSFLKIQNLLNRCNLTNQLLNIVQLNSTCERVKNNIIPQSCTWIDLFLIMMQENWEEIVLQACSSILCSISLGLKLNMESELINTRYMQQHRRLLQDYAYARLKEGSCKVVLKSLCFLYYVVIACSDGTGIYYLLNRMTPSIFQILCYVNSNQALLNIPPLRKEFILTSSTLLYFTKHFQLSHLQSEYYEKLFGVVSDYVMRDVLISKDLQLFQHSCHLIRILCAHHSPWITDRQFESLQQLVSCQFSENSLTYLEMMNGIVYEYPYQLLPETVQKLLLKLLHIQGQIQYQQVVLFYNIVNIIKHHIFNCGNRMLSQDKQTFLTVLKSKSKEMGILIRYLQKNQYQAFKIILQIMSYLIIDDLTLGCELLQNQLRPLVEYEQFRALLHDLDFQIQIDQL